MPQLLDIDEVTILTSFAQALAEAVASAPHRFEDVLADAPAGARWRAELGIVEPSTALGEAFAAITRTTREVVATEGAPTLDAFISALDSARDEEGIDRLVRKVLRSALEQRRFRTRETAS
jgi:glucokinase